MRTKGPAPTPGNHGPVRIRPEVVALLRDADGDRGDWSRWPATQLFHLGGAPFSPAEARLAHSATLAELMAARRAAQADDDRWRRKRDDLCRARDLLASVPGWEAMEFGEIAGHLTPEQQEEIRALASLYPEELAGVFPEEPREG